MSQSNISAEPSGDQTPEQRFLNSARRCCSQDLKQLRVLCALVNELAELIHALQKERGASSIFLGSRGEQFSVRLAERVADSEQLERVVRSRLDHIDDHVDLLRCGARLNLRLAVALRALDSVSTARRQIATMTLVPQDGARALTEIIGSLLAVTFEVADLASDPEIARCLIALVNFSQGKEYAGQERATAGAAISRGQIHAAEYRRWQQLIAAQDQAFRIFSDFAVASQRHDFEQMSTCAEAQELKRLRESALLGGRGSQLEGITASAWYERTTLRIDRMRYIESGLADALSDLCARKLEEDQAIVVDDLDGPAAMLVAVVNPTLDNAGVATGIGLYGVSGPQPKPMRSIWAVLEAQSRRIGEVNQELESTRGALLERKTIERAKGLLMQRRGVSEQEAYAQMRASAMTQNKRMIEIAEALVSMTPMLER
jgi:AmiR/NasT family two-component response regulator